MLNESNLEYGFEIPQASVLIVDDNPAKLMALTAALDGMEINEWGLPLNLQMTTVSEKCNISS